MYSTERQVKIRDIIIAKLDNIKQSNITIKTNKTIARQ